MDAEETIRDYYDALRRGDPLVPYFTDDGPTVKFGVSESLFGADAVSEALEEQTDSTEEWTVESTRLTVDQREDLAWFADEVTLEWTERTSEGENETENERASGERHHFETRWSGTLERSTGANAGDQDDDDSSEPTWKFTSMHVSAPQEL